MGNHVLHIEHIDTEVTRQPQVISIIIDLFGYLERTNFLLAQLLVFTNRISVLGQNSPHKVIDFKIQLLLMLISDLLILGIIDLNFFLDGLMDSLVFFGPAFSLHTRSSFGNYWSQVQSTIWIGPI